MSDPQDHDGPHEGPIKTPKQLIWTVVASFLVPIVIIILLVNYVDFGAKPAPAARPGRGSGGPAPAARRRGHARRLGRGGCAPASRSTPRSAPPATPPALAGAPKFGDAAAWAPRITTGYEALLNSALKGKGAMAAQGGGEYSDYEIGRAVVYMANQGGGKLAEPKAPAPQRRPPARRSRPRSAPTGRPRAAFSRRRRAARAAQDPGPSACGRST